MRLDQFLRELAKRWYITVFLVALAVAGAWLYDYLSPSKVAQATVVVPLQSFVKFDNIVNGRALAVNVSERLDDGTTPEEIEASISGDADVESRMTPLYAISATADDEGKAILIANLAVEESFKLFDEGEAAKLDYVQASFEEQLKQAEAEALAARDDLDRFLAENNAYSFGVRLAEQGKLVASLEAVADLSSGSTAAATVPETGELAEARHRLDRLIALQPEYDRLQVALLSAQGEVQRLEAEINSLNVAGPGFDTAAVTVNSELEEARQNLETSFKDAVTFNRQHRITDLSADIRTQQAEVNDLLLSQVDASSAGGLLATSRAELERLQSLQPELNRLTKAVETAEKRLDLREQQELYVLQHSLPVEQQLEVAATATIQPDTWWMIIRFAAAIMLALFVSFLLVYTLAYFERHPPTADDLERAFGRPVIGHVPKAT